MISLFHHGAIDGVTGSCHEIRLDNSEGFLVDCGIFQGSEDHLPKFDQIPFEVQHLKALIVTHVHIDHVGRIPHLLAAGYKGPIYCSLASAKLLPIVLEDAIKVGLPSSSSSLNRALKVIREKIIGFPYKTWIPLPLENSTKVRFQPAGHILGSSYVEVDISKPKKHRIVFSGDLGASHTPLLPSPKPPQRADTLVLESTYGDRNHQGRKERNQRLKHVLQRCFEDKGLVLIPAFSIGRTQELLYEIENIIFQMKNQQDQVNWSFLDIILDSPMAEKFTDSYREMQHLWDCEARTKLKQHRHPLNFEQLLKLSSHRDHLKAMKSLSSKDHPAIIISAGGMCNGGRIVNWLKANIENPITDILLVGYQAKGTIGRSLQDPKCKKVTIEGKEYSKKANIHTLSGFSAHADQNDLINFAKKMKTPPQKVILVHGINSVRRSFKKTLIENLPQTEIMIPHKKVANKGYSI